MSIRQRAVTAGTAWAASQPVWAEYAYNLQIPASKVAQDVFELHNLIMLVCLGIFIVVFGAMFYSLLKHRKSVGPRELTVRFPVASSRMAKLLRRLPVRGLLEGSNSGLDTAQRPGRGGRIVFRGLCPGRNFRLP